MLENIYLSRGDLEDRCSKQLLLKVIFPVPDMQGVPFPLPCKILRVGFSFLVCILMLGLPLSVAAAHHVRLKQAGLIEDHAGSLRISISPSIARATYLQRPSSCLPSRPPSTSQVLFLLYFMLHSASGHLSICHAHTELLIKE